jgi:two-component system sensor histidine kinase/response regulator
MDDRPIRVLLVDDDEDYYVLTRDLLSEIEGERYKLDWLSTYTAALEAMERNTHDVCLLDFHLGEATGLDLLRAAMAKGCKAPMIMLTGQGDHEVDLEAMLAGAADYLAKGKADAAVLERSMRYAIERARTLQALRESERHIAELYVQEQERRQELERAYADLRRLEGMRDDLTHMIVHDLRNPLTSITANLELIGKTLNNPAHADAPPRFLASARAASQRMIHMIDDLLNVSKFEAGELRPTMTLVHLPTLLADKTEGYRLQAEQEQKTFTFHAPTELPAVMADTGLIARVIDNLVSNAFKYTMPDGHIEITAEQKEQTIMVTVRDDGEGIPPEYHSRIFEKFVQVTDTAGAPLRKGTGLGLAFCRLAVEAHRGKIWVKSMPGQGSAFSFTLPE